MLLHSLTRKYRVLVLFDRGLSTILGRPCAISEEECVVLSYTSFGANNDVIIKRYSYDVDLPAECDDEYWTHPTNPELAFKQPPGKPSTVSYFVAVIKLNCIQVSALRTVVSVFSMSL